jgi:hypothetical protein
MSAAVGINEQSGMKVVLVATLLVGIASRSVDFEHATAGSNTAAIRTAEVVVRTWCSPPEWRIA